MKYTGTITQVPKDLKIGGHNKKIIHFKLQVKQTIFKMFQRKRKYF